MTQQDYINLIGTTFRQASWFQSRGPVLCSQKFFQEFGGRFYVFEYKVTNGSSIGGSLSLPLGMMAEIVNERNTNESLLRVILPPFVDGSPLFPESCKVLNNVDEFICKMKECRQVVALTSDPDSGANIWESSITPIDEVHGLKVTQTILELNTQDSEEWDEVMNEFHDVSKVLTQTKDVPAGYDAGEEVYTFYKDVKCGWYLKTQETITLGPKTSYGEVVNHYWPAVLLAFDTGSVELATLTGVTQDGTEYPAAVLTDLRIQEAYSGPCKALITGTFATASAAPTPTALAPESINYQGIFFNLRIPPTLHGDIEFTENVGTDHPRLKSGQSRSGSFPATNPDIWPSTVTGPSKVRPYKGGYFIETTTIYKPY